MVFVERRLREQTDPKTAIEQIGSQIRSSVAKIASMVIKIRLETALTKETNFPFEMPCSSNNIDRSMELIQRSYKPIQTT